MVDLPPIYICGHCGRQIAGATSPSPPPFVAGAPAPEGEREALAAKVVDAARPFACPGGDGFMQAYHDLEDDVVVWQNSGQCVTAGDVRTLREVLAAYDGVPVSMMHFRRPIPPPEPGTEELAQFIRDNGFVGPDELSARILAAGYRRTP